MKQKNIPADEIIDVLGGPSATARIFGIAPESVTGWKKNGMPVARINEMQLYYKVHFKKIKEFLPM
jgi:hypothetical protein